VKKIILSFVFIICLFNTSIQKAKEVLIYADSINYDSDENLVAKGNVKIISENEVITSNLVVFNEKSETITLPIEFQFKDEDNNYYYGSSGEFSSNMERATINDLKLLLNDGSRIVGKKAIRDGDIDLISKGVYSPCSSKINIKNFICPIWQIEGEKILHDHEKLFLYQKHSKMRILNLPVFYLPYLVSPSPLRKKRKSGFLNPTINFNFLNTKTSQSTSLPYYFAISEDKELLFTPTINYGGGVDSSQRLKFDYYQLISGGNLSFDISVDTNLENQNNEEWIRDASIISNYDKNINENYIIEIESAFQSSPTYLRRTDKDNIINRSTSLSSTVNLYGYDVIDIGDRLKVNISGYQVVKDDEDNKTTPTSFPFISYISPPNEYKNISYQNYYSFYNIFRDKSTDDHSQQQQKLSYLIKTNNELDKFYSKINFKTEFHSQYFNTINKKIDNQDVSNDYLRIFPMSGLYISTPLVDESHNFYLTPKMSFIINSSQSNSNKISNEESTNNEFNLLNALSLNRYTGTDKMDNSKRINYGFEINKDKITFEILQSYEFQKNSNYQKEIGNNDYLSDTISAFKYDNTNTDFFYNLRFNNDQGEINNQNFSIVNTSKIGETSLNYLMEKKSTNSILVDGNETLNLKYDSSKFLKYSSINLSSDFDLINDEPTNYKAGYKYFDECFGVTIDFERSFYSDRDLKPKDILTLMFSFKYLGSYKSSNLAVSETDKQDIRWISDDSNEKYFY